MPESFYRGQGLFSQSIKRCYVRLQRSFLLQKLGTDMDTHSQTTGRARDLEKLSPKWNVSIRSSPQCLRLLSKRGRGDGRHQGSKALSVTMIKAAKNSQSLRQHAQGLQEAARGPLCVRHGFRFRVFMGFLSVQTSGSPILVPSLGLFPFCLSHPTLTR